MPRPIETPAAWQYLFQIDHLRSSIGNRTILNRSLPSSSPPIFLSMVERVRLSSVMIGLLVYM
jgi:hypothetical protein